MASGSLRQPGHDPAGANALRDPAAGAADCRGTYRRFLGAVVKGTAVTSIIGFTELTKTGGMLANATFEPFLIYGLVAVGYFMLCYPLSLSARYLERRLHAPA